ncbi:protein translocase subunit SecD [Pseudoalteromonas aurantia]|uniref:Protein translocase subunit SecD n=1 Tax=Pseudoalteromonas aurantia TaxID=43654 RepID=A0ABY2W055_9GAMM|nr:protein translocase subunit SecD [Pseudoalteromonas aurantia]TMO76401.1 protein translocase subunit SecD [Pseudoalteromonas aurantia]
MKNLSNKKSNRSLMPWVLVLVISMMIISALPNLYPNNTIIKITADGPTISASKVTQLLAQAELPAQEVSALYKTGEIRVLLENPTLSVKAQALLQNKLEIDNVTVHSEATTPAWLQSLNLAPLKLGLDLNGGVLFVLKVETDKALDERLEKLRVVAKDYRIEHKLRGIKIGPIVEHRIAITAAHAQPSNLTRFKQALKQDYPNIVILEEKYKTHSQWLLSFDEESQKKMATQAVDQAISTLRSRIEQLGITEAVTQRQGKHYIRIELPGVQDPAEAKRLIGATAQLSFHALKTQGGQSVNYKNGGTVKLNPLPIFTGSDIESAQASRDESGQPLVQLMLSPAGGEKMRQFSRKNVGKPMSTLYGEYHTNKAQEVVKKQEVISVATIQQVLSRQFSITGLGTMQQAQELAMILRAGSLQAPITIVEEQTIGPSLGEQNIKNGFNALKLGLAITLLFMLFCYGRLGAVAVISLLINLVCLLGLMSLLPGVVLTLPGIAGLVLTIGMAVDTNVIIFERVRDEIKLGARAVSALKHGYDQAMSSIIDANLTTMITALVLLGVGYGPVKGFAITLTLGILTSLFSGVLVSSYLSPLFIHKNNVTKQQQVNKKGARHA